MEASRRSYAFRTMMIRMRSDALRKNLGRISRSLEQAIWVEVCSECGRRGAWVCRFCYPRVAPFGAPGCLRCGIENADDCECAELPPELASIRAAFPFRGWVRSSIHRIKFNGEFARSQYLAVHALENLDLTRIDVLVPVPMHPDRISLRGFNQSLLLARSMSEATGIPISTNAIKRPIKRKPQVGRSRDQRWLAVAGVFAPGERNSDIAGKRIAIVDDVITTGATVSECAIVLMRAGAASVEAVAIARG
jgi:ComF family protein